VICCNKNVVAYCACFYYNPNVTIKGKIKMSIKKIVDESLNTPMTRKEFFGRTGGVLLAVFGVMSVVNALGGQNTNSVARGYGSTPYGGGTDA
jgi:hypothetical protein